MNKISIVFTVFLAFFMFQTAIAQETVNEIDKFQICTGALANGISTYFPQPEYPNEAKEKNISGTVNVRILIDEEGNVTSAKACSGHLLLRYEAEKAAMKAKFRQTTFSGQPVKVSAVVIYKFTSDQKTETKINGIILGKPLNLPKPLFPSFDGKVGKSPSVLVESVIDKQGNVISAKAISGHPVLRGACEAAARASTFSQTKLSGESVKAKVVLLYTFEIEQSVAKTILVKSIYPIGETDKSKKTATISHLSPNTKPIFSPQPEYPAAAKLTGVSGKVSVQILIDENGNIAEAKAVSGNPLLKSAAEKAALQMKFEPIKLGGIPVRARSLVVYEFTP